MICDALLVRPPSRWDEPFGPPMDEATVSELLALQPFDRIDPESFVEPLSLRAIIANDARELRVKEGGIVIRQGDFGTTAFFVLEGNVSVVLGSELPMEAVGRPQVRRHRVFGALAQLWRGHRMAEVRGRVTESEVTKVAADDPEQTSQRLYFKNTEDIRKRYILHQLGPGDIFGEVSALGRTPRTATVFAEGDARILEMRWQGFRDILKRNKALRIKVESLYRQRSLKSQLRGSRIFRHLDDKELGCVAENTLFETYGDYDWHLSYNRQSGVQDYSIDEEPLIAEQGHYADGLIIFCAGFGRTSIRVDHGHRTLSYLRNGDTFGLEEIYQNWRNELGLRSEFQRSLRAVGYAHVLRVPSSIVETYVLERLPDTALPEVLSPMLRGNEAPAAGKEISIDQSMLEFLVEKRFINGTATMIIDLYRCTRCDDCVRACAAGHDGNPRFIRHGPTNGRFTVVNACMHCYDPVCMIGCPTGAIHRRTDQGQVVIEDAICIGCATCANSCPYQNIRMVSVRDERNTPMLNQNTFSPILKATKCDLCAEQMAQVVPACQKACPHDALTRVDMGDKENLAAWFNR